MVPGELKGSSTVLAGGACMPPGRGGGIRSGSRVALSTEVGDNEKPANSGIFVSSDLALGQWVDARSFDPLPICPPSHGPWTLLVRAGADAGVAHLDPPASGHSRGWGRRPRRDLGEVAVPANLSRPFRDLPRREGGRGGSLIRRSSSPPRLTRKHRVTSRCTLAIAPTEDQGEACTGPL